MRAYEIAHAIFLWIKQHWVAGLALGSSLMFLGSMIGGFVEAILFIFGFGIIIIIRVDSHKQLIDAFNDRKRKRK